MVPRKRCGSTKVSMSSSGWPKAASQSPGSRFSHSDKMREARFGECRSGKIRKRLLLAEVPPDPLISHRTLPCRRREAKQRYPFRFPGRDIPKRLAYLGQRPQIMMGLHQLMETRLFAPSQRTDLDLFQYQCGALEQRTATALYTSSVAGCPVFAISR